MSITFNDEDFVVEQLFKYRAIKQCYENKQGERVEKEYKQKYRVSNKYLADLHKLKTTEQEAKLMLLAYKQIKQLIKNHELKKYKEPKIDSNKIIMPELPAQEH